MVKKIWILWYQGQYQMNNLVKNCFSSWEKYNPEWEINLLTESNLNQYLEQDALSILENPNIKIQAKSDIIRINVLAKYGGVWADATCFCCEPLDNWLPTCLYTGFFAFQYPTKKPALISSWFLASSKDNYITKQWCKTVNKYWLDNPNINIWNENSLTRFIVNGLGFFFDLDRHTQKWFRPLVTKIIKVYPYFWFHYLFETLVIQDSQFKTHWLSTTCYSSLIPHRLQYFGFKKALNAEIKNHIENESPPLFKLSNALPYSQDGCIEHLFRFHGTLDSTI